MIATYTRTTVTAASSIVHIDKFKRFLNSPCRPGDLVTFKQSGGCGMVIASGNDTVTVLWSQYPKRIFDYNPLGYDEDFFIPARDVT